MSSSPVVTRIVGIPVMKCVLRKSVRNLKNFLFVRFNDICIDNTYYVRFLSITELNRDKEKIVAVMVTDNFNLNISRPI